MCSMLRARVPSPRACSQRQGLSLRGSIRIIAFGGNASLPVMTSSSSMPSLSGASPLPSSSASTAPAKLSDRTFSLSLASSSLSELSTTSTQAAECPCKPWLLVGLGNPGEKYHGTRHNIGFEMIDAMAEAEGIRLSEVQCNALLGKGKIGPAQVVLAKPQTYVNLSGESVGPLAGYYRIPIQQILVIFDDMDLDFAILRLLPKGGHGGHNGMKSVIEHLQSQEFPRLRIGIGRAPDKLDAISFVLERFSETEREEMDVTIARGINAIQEVMMHGIDKAMSKCNAGRLTQSTTSKKKADPLLHI